MFSDESYVFRRFLNFICCLKMTDKDKALATLSYALVMVLIGLPMWWYTTDVVRFPLPYDRIEEINSSPIINPVHLTVVSEKPNVRDEFLLCEKGSQVFRLDLAARQLNEEEELAVSQAKNVEGLDVAFPSSDTSLLLVDTVKSAKNIVVGRHLSVFFSSDEFSPCQVVNMTREVLLGEGRIEELVTSISAPTGSEINSKWLQRKAPPASDYDVLLTLLVPEPEHRRPTWNVRRAVERYLQPFLDDLNEIISFDVQSQILYLTSLALPSTKKSTDPDSGMVGKVVQRSDLGLAISMESKLISHVSSKGAFNFLAYVPTEEQSPLYVAEEDGKFLASNAFLVPRWGGVSIFNLESKETEGARTIDEKKFMEIVVTQLKLLLGLRRDETYPKNILILSPNGSALTDWEKDFLFRMRLFENLVTAKVTLHSLAHLLSKISNIVITEEVAEKVRVAVEAHDESVKCLLSGRLKPCIEKSKTSFSSSEQVFFDNSLLSLLYFPEDQKYAIYVPLFLPVMLSLLGSLVPVGKDLLASIKKRFKKGHEKSD